MFNGGGGGVPEHIHHFITTSTSTSRPTTTQTQTQTQTQTRTTTTTPSPLSFTYPSYEPPPLFNTHHAFSHFQPNNNHFPHHQELYYSLDKHTTAANRLLDLDYQTQHRPWSSEEVLALLRVRSTMDNWFPEFAWDLVSKKLTELGYPRDAERCKEKFEEEERKYFMNNMQSIPKNNNNHTNNNRIASELEVLYNQQNPSVVVNPGLAHNNKKEKTWEKPSEVNHHPNNKQQRGDYKNKAVVVEETVVDPTVVNGEKENKTRKRRSNKKEEVKELEMFCEKFVKRMMDRQEEMNNRLIGDLNKREKERIEMEDAWKKQELEKMDKDYQLRTQELAIASQRNALMMEMMNNLTNSSEMIHQDLVTQIPALLVLPQNPNFEEIQNPTSTMSPTITLAIAPQNPSSLETHVDPSIPTAIPIQNSNLAIANANVNLNANVVLPKNEQEDCGKRWPKEEVIALINIKYSLHNHGENQERSKAPLWEKISKGMNELGYSRSAKRCKEKWENINKYYRKTKNTNKKISHNSKTCPYFHILDAIYTQGRLVTPTTSGGPQIRMVSSENCSTSIPEKSNKEVNDDEDDYHHHDGGEKKMGVALDFDI